MSIPRHGAKFVDENMKTRNSFTYNLGLVTDPAKFNWTGSCVEGGLYYAKVEQVFMWIDLYWYQNPTLLFVTVPEEENQVVMDPEGNKYRSKTLIVTAKFCLADTKPSVLSLYKINIFDSRYIKFLFEFEKYESIKWLICEAIKLDKTNIFNSYKDKYMYTEKTENPDKYMNEKCLDRFFEIFVEEKLISLDEYEIHLIDKCRTVYFYMYYLERTNQKGRICNFVRKAIEMNNLNIFKPYIEEYMKFTIVPSNDEKYEELYDVLFNTFVQESIIDINQYEDKLKQLYNGATIVCSKMQTQCMKNDEYIDIGLNIDKCGENNLSESKLWLLPKDIIFDNLHRHYHDDPILLIVNVPKGEKIKFTHIDYRTRQLYVSEKFPLLTTFPKVLLNHGINIFDLRYIDFLSHNKKYDFVKLIVQEACLMKNVAELAEKLIKNLVTVSEAMVLHALIEAEAIKKQDLTREVLHKYNYLMKLGF